MALDWLVKLETTLLGRECAIIRREADWAVSLVGGGGISLPVPWRIVADGRIAFANEDDGQWFGLPTPVDGELKANGLVKGRSITKLIIDLQTADLSLQFGSNVRLDAFNNSCGYEGWDISLPQDAGGMEVIALGGGDLEII